MNPTPLDRYVWGYCPRCFTEVAVEYGGTITRGLLLSPHSGRAVDGPICEGTHSRPQAHPGGEVRQAAFADPSKLPTIPCEVY